jgi:hypothetical protein
MTAAKQFFFWPLDPTMTFIEKDAVEEATASV